MSEMVIVDEIRWTAEPAEPLENINLLLIGDDNLLTYVVELRSALRQSRAFVRQVLEQQASEARQSQVKTVRIRGLIEELRRARAELRDLRARRRHEEGVA
jgi:hypothetical protein